MKNTKLTKIITLVLSCLLLIGAAIGISVSAADEPAVSIKAKNIAYEGAIKVLYAVDADNVPEGAEVKMYFYTDAEGDVAYEKAAHAEDTVIGEETYKTFFSEGIAPKSMRTPIYAKAVIVDAEGNVLAESALEEYSIYTYAINRFLKNPTPDQFALYAATLNYGASVQKMLVEAGKMTEQDVIDNGGWANVYCGIRKDVVYNGQTVATGDVTFYAPGEAVTLNAEYNHSDAAFADITDKSGAAVNKIGIPSATVIATEPGVTAYSANYKVTGFLFNTFEDFCIDGSANDVNVLYKGKKLDEARNAFGVYVDAATFGNAKNVEGAGYQRVDVESGNAKNKVYLVGGNGKAGANQFSFLLDEVYKDYDKYIMQFDFNYIGRTDTATSNSSPIFFRIENSGTADTNDTELIYVSDNLAEDFYTFDDIPLNRGEKYTIRFEMEVVNDAMFNLYMYVNGELVRSKINDRPYDSATSAVERVNYFYGMRFFNRSSTDYMYELDNVYVGVEGDGTEKAKLGDGIYADETRTYKYNNGTTVANYVIHGVPDSAKIVDNTLTVNGYGTSIGLKNSGNATGARYIYETDIKFSAGTATKAGDIIAWWGLSAGERGKDYHFASYTYKYNAVDGNIVNYTIYRNDGGSDHIATLNPDEWYNIRIEYTPTTEYQGQVEFYVNGELIITYIAKGYSGRGNITNAKLCCIGHEYRGTSSSGVSGTKVSYANTYLNALGIGAYYNDADIEGTRYDGTTVENVFAEGSNTSRITANNGSLAFRSAASGAFDCNFAFKNATPAAGNVHVFETDIRLASGYSTSPGEDLAWMGMSSAEAIKKENEFLPLVTKLQTDETGTATALVIKNHLAKDAGAVLATLELGKWYNLRFVYTVIGDSSGSVEVFINNVSVATYNTAGYQINDSDAEPNDIFTHLLFQFRGSGSSKAYYLAFDLDNIFLGTFNTAE